MYADDVTAACREIYRETDAFFQALGPELGEAAHRGTSILSGPPPTERPPILFVGYQPGGAVGGEVPPPGSDPWPLQNQYTQAEEDFALARELRRIFPDENYPGFLTSCLGVNAIFLRSPSKAAYEAEVPATARHRIQRFCVEKVRRLITIIQPQHVVAIGLLTLELFERTPTESELEPVKAKQVEVGQFSRWVASAGTIVGREVRAVLHLTGPTGMNAAEREAITRYLRSLAEPARTPYPVAR